jgi:hypothetical protein
MEQEQTALAVAVAAAVLVKPLIMVTREEAVLEAEAERLKFWCTLNK